jgi:hypothetical protein
MEEIKMGVNGQIEAGEHFGWFVRVEDDTAGTGGYYVLLFRSLDPGDSVGFDDWVESVDDVPKLFAERQWKIRWLDKTSDA